MAEQLVLASASPRRRELLAALGVPFVVRATEVDETPPSDATPAQAVSAITRRKLAAARAEAGAGSAVLVADTIVVLDGRVLGKPAGAAAAREMLTALAGRSHLVLTALAVAGSIVQSELVESRVLMRPYTEVEIAGSIAAGTPFDKAGGYAIQDPALHPVARCEGCYCAVMGLPLWTLSGLLRRVLPSLPLTPPDRTLARCAGCPLRPPI